MVQRIAILSDRFPPNWGGGVASAHFHLYRVMKSRGFDVRAFTFLDESVTGEVAGDVVRRTTPHWLVRFIRRANNLAFRLVDPGKSAYHLADIAIRALGSLRLNGALSRFAPDVMILPDHGSPALFIRTIKRCRRVLVAHHNPSRFASLPIGVSLSPLDIKLAMALENRVLKKIDKVICPSADMRQVFSATHDYTGPVEVRHNVIDGEYLDTITATDIRGLLGLPFGAPLIYVPGGGNKFKGSGFIPDLVRVLARQSGAAIGIYLSGAVTADMRGLLAALPDETRIHAPGPLAGPANLALVKACSFGIYPTLAENYSMALLEAVFCGVPMVTFDVGGNAEIIRDGTNGYLVPPYDVDALTAAAIRLTDRAVAEPMAMSTLEDAQRRLGGPAIADAYVRSVTSFEDD